MNYQRIYNEIIENRKKNSYNGYTEKHHIIPRSFGGPDTQENLVRLSAREHFLCHYLLIKINENDKPKFYKMVKAFMLMCWYKGENHKRYVNSRLYKSYKEKYAEAQSINQKGSSNSQYGTMWICNIEKQINKKICKDGPIEEGWVKGKNKWNPIIKQKEKEYQKEQRELLKQEEIKKEKEESNRLLKLFIKLGYTSTVHFVKDGHYDKSYVTLTKLFNKYNKEKYRKVFRKNLSAVNKANMTTERKKELSKKFKGRILSEEHKKNISIALRNSEIAKEGIKNRKRK